MDNMQGWESTAPDTAKRSPAAVGDHRVDTFAPAPSNRRVGGWEAVAPHQAARRPATQTGGDDTPQIALAQPPLTPMGWEAVAPDTVRKLPPAPLGHSLDPLRALAQPPLPALGWEPTAPPSARKVPTQPGGYLDQLFAALPPVLTRNNPMGWEGIGPDKAVSPRSVQPGMYADTFRALTQPPLVPMGWEAVAPDTIKKRLAAQVGQHLEPLSALAQAAFAAFAGSIVIAPDLAARPRTTQAGIYVDAFLALAQPAFVAFAGAVVVAPDVSSSFMRAGRLRAIDPGWISGPGTDAFPPAAIAAIANIRFARGPLSFLNNSVGSLPEGAPFEAGIITNPNPLSVFETLFVGGHDGQNKLLGGGFQTLQQLLPAGVSPITFNQGPPTFTAPAGAALWDAIGKKIWVSNGDGTWTSTVPNTGFNLFLLSTSQPALITQSSGPPFIELDLQAIVVSSSVRGTPGNSLQGVVYSGWQVGDTVSVAIRYASGLPPPNQFADVRNNSASAALPATITMIDQTASPGTFTTTTPTCCSFDTSGVLATFSGADPQGNSISALLIAPSWTTLQSVLSGLPTFNPNVVQVFGHDAHGNLTWFNTSTC